MDVAKSPSSEKKKELEDSFESFLPSKIAKPLNDSFGSEIFDSPQKKADQKVLDVNELSKDYLHKTLDFLKPQFIKDKDGNRPDSPLYNEKTLYVPNSFLKGLTPVFVLLFYLLYDD